jgi:hypothetical protein
VDLRAVTNNGTAYGTAHDGALTQANSLFGRLPIAQDGADDSPLTGVSVDLRSGDETALADGVQVPPYVTSLEYGVFRTRSVLAVYPPA